MPSYWMLRRVALVITNVSEELIASINRVKRNCELSNTDDRSDKFLKNFGSYMSHAAYHSRGHHSS
jgi:hypothetical protein